MFNSMVQRYKKTLYTKQLAVFFSANKKLIPAPLRRDKHIRGQLLIFIFAPAMSQKPGWGMLPRS